MNTAILQQHAFMIIDAINDERVTDEMVRDNEVHNEVFNTDYFIIGSYEARKWINENFCDAFNAIEIVKEYEESNLGKCTTPIDPESIANMLSYICGEEVLAELGEFETVAELKEAVEEYII